MFFVSTSREFGISVDGGSRISFILFVQQVICAQLVTELGLHLLIKRKWLKTAYHTRLKEKNKRCCRLKKWLSVFGNVAQI
jgi:hypothetical protein